MKKLFLEARYRKKVSLTHAVIKRLPNRILLATTVQFMDSLDGIKKALEKNGKKMQLIKGIHSKYNGQALGCDILASGKEIKADCVLYVGTGRFHPVALAYKYKLKTFLYDPFSKKLDAIKENEIKKIDKIRTKGINKFHASKNIGIIKTTKPGQSVDQKKIKDLKEKYKNKVYYDFISDNIDFLQLNNFIFIDCWVNTACPRIAFDDHDKLDKTIVNIVDLI